MNNSLLLGLILILAQGAFCTEVLPAKNLTADQTKKASLKLSQNGSLNKADKGIIWTPPKKDWTQKPVITEKLKKSRIFEVDVARAVKSGGVDLGGGVTVNINNRPALRDLVDSTTCQWISSSEFVQTYTPGVHDVVKKVRNVHWYLADIFNREIENSIVCLTAGPLKKIPDQDLDAVTVYDVKTKQAAIRAGQLIFVDMTVFTQMLNQTHRDFLFVHELSQSLIPFDTQNVRRRYDSLRSFVLMLSGEFDSEQLALNIEANQVNVPPMSKTLAPYQKSIQAAFNSRVPLSTRAKLSVELGQSFAEQLWNGDRRKLNETVGQYVEVSDQVRNAIMREDFKLLEYLISEHNINIKDKLFVAHANKCYYYPTLLQIALYTCGSQPPALRFQPNAVSFVLKSLRHAPTKEEVRFFITRTLQVTPKYYFWFPLWEKNPQFDPTYASARELVESILPHQLHEFSEDPIIRKSDVIMDLIRARIYRLKKYN